MMITLKCDVRFFTGDGALLRFGGIHGEELWFPRNKINDNGDGTVTMPREIAQRKGVESYEA